jgi:hypothetical protein
LTYRITYDKIDSGIIKSRILTADNGAQYFVVIDYNKGNWQVFNAKRRNKIKEGFNHNKNVLRRQARKALKELGVKFENEFKPSGYAKTGSPHST